MKNGNEKKGFFERLIGGNKTKKNSCCCNIEIEEIPEERSADKDPKDPPKPPKNSCCN